jgi:arylsulfatase A-like enzyme
VPVTIPHSRYRGDIFEQSDPLATPAGMLERAPQVMMSRQEIVQRVTDAGLPAYAREGLWLDEGFNAILRKLQEIGQAEDTCVIFTTDHPTAGKETCHLGRIPFLARWPGRIPPGTESQALLAQTDLAPTILDIAGCDVPTDMRLDGQSLKPLLLGQTAESHRDSVLLEVVNSRALVSAPWKYIANRWPDYLPAIADINKTGWLGTTRYDNACIRDSVPYQADKLWPAYFCADQLYNVKTDPCEQRDLSQDPVYAETLAEMQQKSRTELAKLPHAFGEFR